MKKAKRITLLFFVAIMMLAVVATPAQAVSVGRRRNVSELKGTVAVYLRAKNPETANGWGAGWQSFYFKKGEVKNLKSSKTSVLDAHLYESEGQMVFTGNKPGTAKVTFKYNGKKRTVKVVVKRYVNAFKRLTIGGKSYKKGFNSLYDSTVSFKKLRGKKISVAPAKGWKLVNIVFASGSHGDKLAAIRNNAKVPKKASYVIYITLQNKSNKGTITYILEDNTTSLCSMP